MVVKNLTDKLQTLVVKPLLGEDREYDIYLNPKSTTDLDRHLVVVNKDKLKGLVEFEGENVEVVPVKEEVPETPAEEVPKTIVEETPVAVEETSEEEAPVEEAPAPDKFVCEVCGAEFASNRGLTTHMNKVHSK